MAEDIAELIEKKKLIDQEMDKLIKEAKDKKL